MTTMSGLTATSHDDTSLRVAIVGNQGLVGVGEELGNGPEHLARGGRFLLADLGLGSSEKAAIAPESGPVGEYHLVTLTSQAGDETTRTRLRVIGMPSEYDHTELPAGFITGLGRNGEHHRGEQDLNPSPFRVDGGCSLSRDRDRSG